MIYDLIGITNDKGERNAYLPFSKESLQSMKAGLVPNERYVLIINLVDLLNKKK